MGYISIIVIGSALMLSSTLFALCKGGPSERWTGALILGSWLCAYGLELGLRGHVPKDNWELVLLAADGIEALALLALAIRYTKLWLGTAMLMQSAALALHGVAMADWGFDYFYYLAFNNMVSFAILVLLACATAFAWRDRRRAAKQSEAPDDGRPGWAAPLPAKGQSV